MEFIYTPKSFKSDLEIGKLEIDTVEDLMDFIQSAGACVITPDNRLLGTELPD